MGARFFVDKMERFSLKRRLDEDDFENDLEAFLPPVNDSVNEVASTLSESLITFVNQQIKQKNKQPNKDRLHLKTFRLAGYDTWSAEGFKERKRINLETLDFILERIVHLIHKEPTYMVSNPIKDLRQLGLTIYRLAHSYSFKVIMDIFGVSQFLATETFNNVIKCMVLTLYDKFVCLPRTEADRENVCKGFIENYEFSCVGAWDGFHIHVACCLKNYISSKKKYTVTSMGLIAHNKRFLHLTTGTRGSIHDARLLRYFTLFKDIQPGGRIPNKSKILGDFGEIPLVTIGDTAFPCLEKFLKSFSENTPDLKKRYDKKNCVVQWLSQKTLTIC